MRLFAEEGNVLGMIIPVDLAGAAGGAAVGRIDTKHYGHFEILIFKAAGAAAEPIVLTLTQYDAASAGNSKALPIPNGVYVKAHANIEDATAFVKEARDPSNTEKYTGTSAVQKEGIFLVPIDPEYLDVENGYRWFDVAIADTGSAGACLGAAVVLGFDPRYTPPPDAI